MKKFLFFLIILFSIDCFSQGLKPVEFYIKAGMSAGGSKPASMKSGNESIIIFAPTGAIGINLNFNTVISLSTEVKYIKKGVNCKIEYDEIINTEFALSSPVLSENSELGVVWSESQYIEIPLCFGFNYGFGLGKTKIGAYYSHAIKRKGEIMFYGYPFERKSTRNMTENLVNEYISKNDVGIIVSNEFYLGHFSLGLEFSGGFLPALNPKNDSNKRKSSNMCVAF